MNCPECDAQMYRDACKCGFKARGWQNAGKVMARMQETTKTPPVVALERLKKIMDLYPSLRKKTC